MPRELRNLRIIQKFRNLWDFPARMILLEAAAAGLGIACLPTKLCRQSVEQGRLERVLPRWSTPGVTTTLLMPHRRGQLPSVRAVADFLIEKLTM